MKLAWGQLAVTAGVAALIALGVVGATVGLKPSGVQVRDYLMTHPEVIPAAMEALQARETGKVVAANRAAIERPVGDAWLGNPNGDVTVVEFFDYNCGYCRASLPIIAQLVKADPQVKVVFRELPVLAESSYDAMRVSYAAARLGKFRAFHDPLYQAGPVTAQSLAAVARSAGLTPAAIKRFEPAADAEAKANIALARQLALGGTPGWVIGQRAFAGLRTLDEMQAMVKLARAGG